MKSAISWFDIPTIDFDRAVKFYSEVLDKEIRVSDYMGQKLGFFPVEKDGEVGGDLVPAGMGNEPSKTGTRVYLNCDNLDEALDRVEKAGGKITQPKTSIEKMGFFAFIEDTEGNVVGLWGDK